MPDEKVIEVFKTNVADLQQAEMLTDLIHLLFRHYEVTFDLEDCDRIMCIKSTKGQIQSSVIIRLLRISGYDVEILTDDASMFTSASAHK